MSGLPWNRDQGASIAARWADRGPKRLRRQAGGKYPLQQDHNKKRGNCEPAWNFRTTPRLAH